MRTLKRLKDFLTGEEAEEKDKSKETPESKVPETVKESDETEIKQETGQADDKAKEASVVEEEPAAEVAEITVEEIKEAEEPEKIPEAEAEKNPVVEEEPPTEAAKTTIEEEIEEGENPEISEEVIEEEKEAKPKGSVSMTMLNKEENLIRGEEVDNTFKQDIMDAGAETVALCYQCGTCTGSCPSGKRTPYRIRSIIRKSLMGLRNEVMNDETIWECVTCYACQERCPRGVAIVDVVKVIRNMQSQAGKMAQAHKMVGTFVLKTGHGVPINDATMELRKSVGLNELPPTTHEFPEALKEVQDILKKTQFDSLIGYNWETGELE